MEKEKLLEILEKHQYAIEANNWEKVYEYFFYEEPNLASGEFSDFLIQNGVDPNSMFKHKVYHNAFQFSKLLRSINILEGVTEIGQGAFYCCRSLKSITIPDSVTEIGSMAFDSCESLESIIIPKNVKKIGDRAFYCCELLTSVTIPNNITKIGSQAFYDCRSLTSITLPKSLTKIGPCAFSHCSSLKEIKYDGSKEEWKKVKLCRNWIACCPISKEENKIIFLR